MRDRRYLSLATAAAFGVGITAFAVATWAFDDNSSPSSDAPWAAAPINSGVPGQASAAQQADAEDRIASRWTPDALRQALAADQTTKPSGPSGSNAGSGEPAPAGGSTTDPSPSPASVEQPKGGALAVECAQPKKLKPLAGYAFTRGCYAGKLTMPPSKQIGRLFSWAGESAWGFCTASVAETGVKAQGQGNHSVVVTAGHCVGDEPDPDEPGSTWKPNQDPLFIPQPKIRALHNQLADPNVSISATKAWLKKNAWFPRTNPSGDWVGFVPVDWLEKGDWSYDFATVVMAPRGTTTIYDALGGLGVDMKGVAPKAAVSLGYPSKQPFDGRRLFGCTGDVRVGNQHYTDELGIGCDMSPGSSGGPWFRGGDKGAWSIISVNSYGPPEIMYGPRLNGRHWPTFMAARNYGQAP